LTQSSDAAHYRRYLPSLQLNTADDAIVRLGEDVRDFQYPATTNAHAAKSKTYFSAFDTIFDGAAPEIAEDSVAASCSETDLATK